MPLDPAIVLGVRNEVDEYLEKTVLKRYRPLVWLVSVLSLLISAGTAVGAWAGYKSWVKETAKEESRRPAQETAEAEALKIKKELEEHVNKDSERIELKVERTTLEAVRRQAGDAARDTAKSTTLGLKAEELATNATFTASLIAAPVFEQAIAARTQDIAFPAGTIVAYGVPVEKDPGGWLLCDGRWLTPDQVEGQAAMSSRPYQNLFDQLKSSWGDETRGKRKLPDLRGMFLRGVDARPRGEAMDTDLRSTLDTIRKKRPDLGMETKSGVGSYQWYATAAPWKEESTHNVDGSARLLGLWGWEGERPNHYKLGGSGQPAIAALPAGSGYGVLGSGFNPEDTRPMNAAANWIIKY